MLVWNCSQDHFNQKSNFDGYQEKYVDLWDGAGPDTNGRDGEYSVFRDAGEAVRVIRAHGGAASKPPLYLHIMFQTCHSPYQVPPQYEDQSINDTVRLRPANTMRRAKRCDQGICRNMKSVSMY